MPEPLPISTASSEAPSQTIFRFKHRPNSSLRSTSRPPRYSVSLCRQRYLPAPM